MLLGKLSFSTPLSVHRCVPVSFANELYFFIFRCLMTCYTVAAVFVSVHVLVRLFLLGDLERDAQCSDAINTQSYVGCFHKQIAGELDAVQIKYTGK